jgi:hypothetical protein
LDTHRGEIALIVVGILIAVQIGNLNQEHRNRIEGKEVLTELKEELESALLLLSGSRISAITERRQALERVQLVFLGAPIENPFEFLSNVFLSAKGGLEQGRLPQPIRIPNVRF